MGRCVGHGGTEGPDQEAQVPHVHSHADRLGSLQAGADPQAILHTLLATGAGEMEASIQLWRIPNQDCRDLAVSRGRRLLMDGAKRKVFNEECLFTPFLKAMLEGDPEFANEVLFSCEGIEVPGSVTLWAADELQGLPRGFRVEGSLHLEGCSTLSSLPEGLRVGNALVLGQNPSLASLGPDLQAGTLVIDPNGMDSWNGRIPATAPRSMEILVIGKWKGQAGAIFDEMGGRFADTPENRSRTDGWMDPSNKG